MIAIWLLLEMKLLPKTPTDEMIKAGRRALGEHIRGLIKQDPSLPLQNKGRVKGINIDWRTKLKIRYEAMYAAAPDVDAIIILRKDSVRFVEQDIFLKEMEAKRAKEDSA